MDIKNFRKVMNEHCSIGQGIEEHKNDFKIMCSYVIINDIISLHDINRIKLVGDEKGILFS